MIIFQVNNSLFIGITLFNKYLPYNILPIIISLAVLNVWTVVMGTVYNVKLICDHWVDA